MGIGEQFELEKTGRITSEGSRPVVRETPGMRVSVLGPDPIGAFVNGWLLAKLAVARAPVVSMSTPTAEKLAVLAGRVCGGYGFTVQTAIPGVAAERVDGYMGVDLMISDDVPDGWVRFE